METNFALCATKQINILTLVFTEFCFLNETKNHNPPLEVKWSVPYWITEEYFVILMEKKYWKWRTNHNTKNWKIEKREPHWKPWVNSSAPEGWTYPVLPVAPNYITFTIRRMCITQVQSNYTTCLQLIFIILTISSYSSLKRKTGHKQDYVNTHTHMLYYLPVMKCE